MKNNNNNIIIKFLYSVLVVLFISANAVFSKPVFNAAIKTVAVKYGLTMFAIVIFSVAIYIGLSVYNKFFVSSRINDCNLNQDSLKIPIDKDDAILTFITKNRLR